MSTAVCIYPEDITTAFLRPLCNHICSTFNAVEVGYDTSIDDDPLEIIHNAIRNAKTVFFLGHGMSTCLYASVLDNVELFNKDNYSLLEGKRLFLLACNSDQFIKNYDLENSIGFGFLPTSLDDIRQKRLFHSILVETLEKEDVELFNEALVNAVANTLSDNTISDPNLFVERFRFAISGEIVQCLLQKKTSNYRTIADELYYVFKDMIVC